MRRRRRPSFRLRFFAGFLLSLLGASAAVAWVQINTRELGNPDFGLFLATGSITFVLEQDGSFSTNAGEPASELDALRATFTAINNITTSNATVVDGGTFDFTPPIDDDDPNTGGASLLAPADGTNRVGFFNTDNNGDFGGLAVAVFAFTFAPGMEGNIIGCDIGFLNTPASGITWSVATPADPNMDLGVDVFDIQEVMNQEVQHCFGFEHTPVVGPFEATTGYGVRGTFTGDFSLQASLYPFATGTIQGRTFESDDIAAFTALYPSAMPNAGKITGTVTTPGGGPVKGAHVVAVSMADPTTPVVGALSGVDSAADVGTGTYTIRGVPPGTYLVRIEPMLGDINLNGVVGTNRFTEADTFFSGFETRFPGEFHSGASESGTDVAVTTDDAMPVTVMDGVTTSGVNFVVNLGNAATNDNFANRTVIGTNSFRDFVDTTAATVEMADPIPSCTLVASSRANSVWYSFTAPSNGTITANLFGSNYDTVLTVITGSPPGTEVACNDEPNFPINVQSEVTFAAASGQTYNFMASDRLDIGGGNLAFSFTFTAAAPSCTINFDDSNGNGLWQQAANWDTNVLPVSSNDVCIGVVGGPFTVTKSGSDGDTINSLTVADGQGVFTLNADLSIAAASTIGTGGFTQSGGTLSGAGSVTISGLFTWSGGVQSGMGTTNANGGMTLSSTSQKTLGRTLNNTGMATWTGGDIAFDNAVFNNQPAATFDIQTDTTMFPITFRIGTFNNAGTLTKSAGAGTTAISSTAGNDVAFNNTGTVSVNRGTFQFRSGTSSGSFNVGAGATITFTTSHTLQAGASFGGAGRVLVSIGGGGTLSITGDLTSNVATLEQTAGTVSGTGTLDINGLFLWSGGSHSGAGVTNANGGLSLTGSQKGISSGRTLNNAGLATWTGASGIALDNGGMITNLAMGTFDIQNDNQIFVNSPPGTVNNAGMLTKSAGAGTTTIGLGVAFNNTGTVNANSGTLSFGGTFTQTAGVTGLNGGAISTTSSLSIQGGLLEGADASTITGSVNNSGGMVGPGLTPGILNISGAGSDYTQGAGGTLAIELGGLTAGTEHDRLTVADVASLGGTLNVSLIGVFTPSVGDMFTIMTYASRSGTFTTVNVPTLPSGGWNVDQGATAVILTVVPNAPPMAMDDTATMNEDTPGGVTINVLANDSDPDGPDPLSVTAVSTPANGTAVINVDNTVTYTPNADFNGSDMFTYDVSDGADTSTATVTITINAVNDPPIFTPGLDQTVLEDAGAQSVAWATGIAPGPPTATDEAGQTVSFTVTNTNNSLFSAQPAIDAAGTLTYVPAADQNGTATVTVTAVDSGGASSAAVMFTITVTAVNDAPSFTAGPNQTALAGSGAQTATNWATNISAGPANEASQTLTFIVTNDNNALFSVQPAISATGTLTYTPVAMGSGVATVTVTLMDNGGTANGGMDTSASQMFTITVNDFTLMANPNMGTITAGQSFMTTVTATAMPTNINLQTNFSCTNLPVGASCAFSPSSVASISTAGTAVMLTVNTTARTVALMPPAARPTAQPPLHTLWLGLPGLALVGVVLAGRRSRRRQVAFFCLVVLLLLTATLLAGCGGGSFFEGLAQPPQVGTPAGTHMITVNATAGSVQRSVTVTVVVQ